MDSLKSPCPSQTVWPAPWCWPFLWSPLSLLSHWGPRWTHSLRERQRRHLSVSTANTRVGVQVRKFAWQNGKISNLPFGLKIHIRIKWLSNYTYIKHLSPGICRRWSNSRGSCVWFAAYHARCYRLQQFRNEGQLHHGVVRAVPAGELHISSPQAWRVRALLVQPGSCVLLWRHWWLALVTEWNLGENRRNHG